jgi:hypothetical protein
VPRGSFARRFAAVNARRGQPNFASRAQPWLSFTIRPDVHQRFTAIVARASRAHRAHLRAIGRTPVGAGSRLRRRTSPTRISA